MCSVRTRTLEDGRQLQVTNDKAAQRIELAIDGRRLLCLPYDRANALAAELGRASTALIDHMTAPTA